MSSVGFCHSYKAKTNYICLISQTPVCTQLDCSVLEFWALRIFVFVVLHQQQV